MTEDGQTTSAYVYGSNLDWATVVRPDGDETPTFDARQRLQSFDGVTYSYDATGNRSSTVGAVKSELSYDTWGNLAEVEGGAGTLTYHYDGFGRRVAKLRNGTRERGWLYRSPYQVVAELDAAGTVASRFVYFSRANVPDLMTQGGETYRLVTDLQGSVRMVVNIETGEVAQQLDYGPWGDIRVDTNPGFQPFGFAGGIHDADTGYVHFGMRDYDPATGRFLQTDPALFGSGYAQLHAYAGFDPVNRIDRTGGVPRSVLDAYTWAERQGVLDFAAGVADGVSAGMGGTVRDVLFDDLNEFVNACSWSYIAGDYAGQLLMLRAGLKVRQCFTPETLVWTEDGLTPIEDVEVGSRVWSRHDETGEESWQPVQRVFVTPDAEVIELTFEDESGEVSTLRLTAEHPLFTAEGSWVDAGDLVVGDRIATVDDGYAELLAVEVSGERSTVYNLEVAHAHTYFVADAGLWAHNGCGTGFKFRRWKRGDPIDKIMPDGSSPSWDTVRSRYWKNRHQASRGTGEFSPQNMRRMRRGNAPRDYNPRTGRYESRELHHVDPQRAGGSNGPFNLREVTPDQHAAIDPYRRVGR